MKWIEEDRISVIPSTWVIQPSPLPDAGFPIKGKYFFRKKTNVSLEYIPPVSHTFPNKGKPFLQVPKTSLLSYNAHYM